MTRAGYQPRILNAFIDPDAGQNVSYAAMAEANGSGSGWPGFVGQLNKTFMLVRDAFGYALPGGVFLAIGLICKGYTLSQIQSLLSPYTLPPWAAFIAVVAACYAAGHVMAGVAYWFFDVLKYIVWMLDRHWKHLPDLMKNWLADNPTEVTKEALAKRVQHPDLFNILDRRETGTLTAGSMAAALLVGWYVFCHAQWSISQILFWAGLFMAIDFLTGLSHLRRVAKAVRDAEISSPNPDPDLSKLLEDFFTAATKLLKKLAP